MISSDQRIARFDGAVLLLPYKLRDRARTALRSDRERAEELRLRVGRPLTLLLPEGELDLGGEPVTVRDLAMLVEIATGASVHASAQEIRAGYIACRGGYRVGLGGSVTLSKGEVSGFAAWSSAAIRIAREHPGIADELIPKLFHGGHLGSTLILAPPGAGKTTLLREMVRRLSDGGKLWPGSRVALSDERGEVAALWEGIPQMDVGRRTDVLDACPKAQGVMMLLRSMNPQVIALDEITAPEDVTAIERARNCGVALLATAHAGSLEDLRTRPLYRPLFEEKVFENYVVIQNTNGKRSYEVKVC